MTSARSPTASAWGSVTVAVLVLRVLVPVSALVTALAEHDLHRRGQRQQQHREQREDGERRRMLAQHGQQARGYADVRANTVASFALGDYEWMLAFEADELHRIVDLMRDLRASDARRHVREEVPFYTGARVTPAELLDRLP